MNGQEGSVAIDIAVDHKSSTAAKTKAAKHGGYCAIGAVLYWVHTAAAWRICEDDRLNKMIFGFKVGLAVLLVSLLILIHAPYEAFGTNIIWSVITVVVMFEYTVGMTFNRGFNRALGSIFSGILAISVAQLALSMGSIGEPTVIGVSVFLVGAITSFMKLLPSLARYEYGFRVALFTYCMIIMSGYRMGNPIRTAMDRLYSIAMGGFVAVTVNALVFPMWAGEQLHKELVKGFEAVADSLEECVAKYLEDERSDGSDFSRTVIDEFQDEPAYKRCRNTLNTSAKLESLANSAKWEPPHGRFKHLYYPWSEYLKVGAVLRHCAYEVMALHGVLHSEIQAPCNLRAAFQSEIRDATSQAAELVRSLGKDISNMEISFQTHLLKRVHSSTERLQHAIDLHSYLLTSSFEQTDSAMKPLQSKLSHTLSSTFLNDLSAHLAKLGPTQNLAETPRAEPAAASPHTVVMVRTDSYHEMMRKQSRRLYSWPSREVDVLEEEGSVNQGLVTRMRASQCTASLSLATFASLLIEFVARLDHLVEAVDELSRLAKFKHEGLQG